MNENEEYGWILYHRGGGLFGDYGFPLTTRPRLIVVRTEFMPV